MGQDAGPGGPARAAPPSTSGAPRAPQGPFGVGVGGGGSGRRGRGLGHLDHAPAELAPPRPLRGVLRVKRRAARPGLHFALHPGRVRPRRGGLTLWRSEPASGPWRLALEAPSRTPPGPGPRPRPRPGPGPAPAPAPRADGLLLPQFVRLVRGGHGGVRLRRLRRLQPAWRLPIQPLATRLPRSRAALPRARLLQLRAWRPS